MNKLIKDCFTENDGKSYDPIRVWSSISMTVYLSLSVLELIRHAKDFSLTDMATGISILLGVMSAGITIKSKSEPNGS